MTDTPTDAANDAPTDMNGWDWGIVEIFGHRRHAGRVREEERFGTKMLRVDVPVKGDPIANGWETHWYGGASIFSFALTNENTVMRANKPYEAPSRFLAPPPDDDEPTYEDEPSDEQDGEFDDAPAVLPAAPTGGA